jgi:DNA-binding NarL/FixJ family response regulator
MTRIGDLKRRIRVVIVDDHEVIRAAVRALLESHARFQVCGEGATGAQAVQLAQGLRPDVVILNITMPLMDGFAAARLIRTAHPACAIVILSSQKDDQIIAYARSLGVQGFVDKTEAARELVNVIDQSEIGEEFAVAE